MSSKKKTAAKTAARARTAAAAVEGTNGHESKFAQRQRFTTASGAKLDVNVKQNGDGKFKTYVLHKKSAPEGEKAKALRGMAETHDSQPQAMKAYEALIADARNNGWTPAATTRRETFSSMPKAE